MTDRVRNYPGFYNKDGSIKKKLINNLNWLNDPVTLNRAVDPRVLIGDTTSTVFSNDTIKRLTTKRDVIRHPITRKLFNVSDSRKLPDDIRRIATPYKSKLYVLSNLKNGLQSTDIMNRMSKNFFTKARAIDGPKVYKNALKNAKKNINKDTRTYLTDLDHFLLYIMYGATLPQQAAQNLYQKAVGEFVNEKTNPGDMIIVDPQINDSAHNSFRMNNIRIVDPTKTLKPVNKINAAFKSRVNWDNALFNLNWVSRSIPDDYNRFVTNFKK